MWFCWEPSWGLYFKTNWKSKARINIRLANVKVVEAGEKKVASSRRKLGIRNNQPPTLLEDRFLFGARYYLPLIKKKALHAEAAAR